MQHQLVARPHLSALLELTHFILMTAPYGRYYYHYSHFTELETEAWRGDVTCPRSLSFSVMEQGMEPKQPGSREMGARSFL